MYICMYVYVGIYMYCICVCMYVCSPAPSMVSLDSSAGIPVRKSDEELRCVVAIIRHADRTPKQKMKISVTVT